MSREDDMRMVLAAVGGGTPRSLERNPEGA